MPDSPMKFCECGCGGETSIVKVNERKRGRVKGERARFLPGHYRRSGELSGKALAERRAKVLEGYLEGKTLDEIAERLGIKKSHAHSDVVALRRLGDLPEPSRCKAIRRDGRKCGSRASANGYCGAHGFTRVGRPRSDLPVSIEGLAQRYRNGESIAAIATDTGIGASLLGSRLKEHCAEIRPVGCVKGQGPKRFLWLDSAEIVEGWKQGLTLAELSRKFGVASSTIWGRLAEELGDAFEQKIRRLYVDEELPIGTVAEFVGCSETTVWRRLKAMGIDTRHARVRRRPVAMEATIQQVRRAAESRGRRPSGDLTEKQGHLLNILRASPLPLPAWRVGAVAETMPKRWTGVRRGEIVACLRRLEARGLVSSVVDPSAGHYRGRDVLVWFPATAEIAAATSPDAARRLREIQALVEAQAQEERGEWVESERGHWFDRSLDAPLTDSGDFTILDTLGDEDEALQELMEAAA